MILADKIIDERKKNGWSQEELAEQLGVSRQSVSKWESAGSVPDLKKVIQMAELFGVSTDYLLKDELEKENRDVVETSGSDADSPLRRVSMEEANAFLNAKRETAPRLANTVSLFILSPVALLLLAVIAESPDYNLAEGPAMAVGLAVLLLLTAVGVFIQITDRNKLSCFEYLERESFETEYGVSGMVKEKKRDYESRYSLGLAGGTVICIVAVIPLLVAGVMESSDLVLILCVDLLLALVALGANLIVRVSTVKESYDTILQEGDYAKNKKRIQAKMGAFSAAYWCLVTAIYLGWSTWRQDWEESCIIWAVAGVLYAGAYGIVRMVLKEDGD
nr:helix-turn-helix transcriptional regulator [uncultured Stomatobaculum sp.]